MNEDDRDRYLAAHKAWDEAETAYSELASKHITVWWVDSGEPAPGVEPLTKDSLKKLAALRQVADEKQQDFETVARSLGFL